MTLDQDNPAWTPATIFETGEIRQSPAERMPKRARESPLTEGV